MRQVLIVEDDSEGLKADLEGRGYAVIGSVPSCEDALRILADHRPDLAVVDTRLGQETSEPILEECDRRNISVVIYSGHSKHDLPSFARGREILGKPYHPKALDDLLATLEAS